MAIPVADSVPLLTASNNNNGTLEDEFISGLAQGGSWDFGGGPRAIAYSLDLNFGGEPVEWSPAWTTAIRRAFHAWEKYIDVEFARSGTPGAQLQNESTADIAIALEPNGGPVLGIGIFPDPDFAEIYIADLRDPPDPYLRPEGDISFDSISIPEAELGRGGWGYYVVLHEIGHALGLKHTNDDGGNDRPAFEDLGIDAFQSRAWTIMQGGTVPSSHVPATPGLLDVLAIQHIYGANMLHRTGDDIYTVGNRHFHTIWDAGGVDTLSAESWSRPEGALIDLRDGAFSGSLVRAKRTAIAFDVTIENAIGSDAADRLVGNRAANRLEGGAGDDTLLGGAGADILRGGSGNDVLVWSPADPSIRGGAGADTLRVRGSGVLLDLATVEEGTIRGVERIDLGGNGGNTLTLGVGDVLDLSATTGRLKILGNADDAVNIGPGWEQRDDLVFASNTYFKFRQGEAVLLVDDDVAIVLG